MEHAVRPRTDCFVSENSTRHDDAHGRFALLHFPHLHGRRVRPQQHIRFPVHKERVLHIAGRVLFGEVEATENVPVVFDFRPFRHHKSHALENADDLPSDHAQRMVSSHGKSATRACPIELRSTVTGGLRLTRSALSNALLNLLFELINELSKLALLLVRGGLEVRHHILHFSLSPQPLNAKCFHLVCGGQLNSRHFGCPLRQLFLESHLIELPPSPCGHRFVDGCPLPWAPQ